MGFLSRIFGRGDGNAAAGGLDVDGGVGALTALYEDPEVRSERGISLTSPRAAEVRAIGRRLHKAGGKEGMREVRDRFRERHGWAAANLEAIWASMPEWRT